MENNTQNPLFTAANGIKEVSEPQNDTNKQEESNNVTKRKVRANVESNDDVVYPFTNEKEGKVPKGYYQELELPICRTNEFVKAADKIDGLKKSDITPEIETLYVETLTTQGAAASNDLGANFADENELVNKVMVGDKELGINNLKLKATNNQNINVLRFKSLINLGTPVQVTLYHSGFNITLTPPTNLAINSLDLKVTTAQLELGRASMGLVSQFLGRDTTGLLTSNKKYFTINILKPFILDHIIDYSLDVPKEELFNHISMLDLKAILLGLIQASNGARLNVKRICSNLYQVEDGKPKCSAIFDGIVDTSKLLFVNREMFREYKNMLGILSRKEPKSSQLCDVEEYVSSYKEYLRNKGYGKPYITPENNLLGVNLEIQFKIPTINEYLEASVLPLEKIATELENITLTEDPKDRKETIEGLAESIYLTSLSSSVEYIGYRDPETNEVLKLTKQEDIIEMLSTLSQDGRIAKELEEELVKFLGNSMVSLVATPRFICPKCGSTQDDQVIGESAFTKDLIPLEIVHFFFYQTRVKLTRQQNQPS